MKTFALCTTAVLASLSLTACAENYAAEGALGGAAAGALAGQVISGDPLVGAAVGAAAGGAAGYFIDKDNKCDGYDKDGRLDDDCRGTAGYPN